VVDHHRFKTGDRATFDPFDALAGDVPSRDQGDLMEGSFFSLAKTKRVQPILYKSGATEVQVYALPEHVMPTIWDADVLISAASQILAAMDRGIHTPQFFRLTPYRLLTAVGRATGKREYVLLKGALSRLQSTFIRTTIRHGEHWRRQQFSWINEWEDLLTHTGRCEGIEFVLPESFYQGVLDAGLVLAIDPAYFALTGGIERWLYRVARKHAGRQLHRWRFELRHLYAKSASLVRCSGFALDVRRILCRQPLLGYALAIEHASDCQEVIVMRAASTAAADNLRMTDPSIRILGANHIGISGARISGLPAHNLRPSDWNGAEAAPRKDTKSESKLSIVNAALRYRHGDKRLAGGVEAS
jgi:plasmid replication initiation protein